MCIRYNGDYNGLEFITAEYVHSYTTEGWVKEQCSKFKKESHIKLTNIFENLDESLKTVEIPYISEIGSLCFSTLEMAKAAKIIHIKNNSDYYKYDIHNIEKPLKEVKEKYPEYFI